MTAETGDLAEEELRLALHRVADHIADYLEHIGERPVTPGCVPGEVAADLPAAPPEAGEPLPRILDDYERLIEPRLTQWNHPGFLAYFGITGSGPGIVGESLAAAANVVGMLWHTAPAAVELEARVADWVRQMVGLPEGFHGHINDTASTSTLVALAAAREAAGLGVREHGLSGRDLPPLVVYCSEQAHSSVDKAVLTLGIGLEQVRRVPTDEAFRMRPEALAEAMAADRAAGRRPIAVVATAGTTSTTSVDPVDAIADLCTEQGVWLHVDAAYAGPAASCPELRPLFAGWERADSLVLNPHKWLFTPVHCSLLYVRDVERLKRAFSLVPSYLESREAVVQPMDLGFQLGRRFRSLKLWMVIRSFGVEGIRARLRDHCRLARELASWVDDDPDFERVAPVPFSVVCLRARFAGAGAEEEDRLQRRLLDAVNDTHEVFLSGTELAGRYTLRVAVGNLRTQQRHVRHAWDLLRREAARLRSERDADSR